jgi:hypothetical protein
MKNTKTQGLGFSAIIIFLIAIVYLIFSEQKLKPSDYISSLASLSIVFLTAGYVLITSKQLIAMKGQLDEMKKGREHTSQPIAFITPSNIILEKPRLFFSPPEKEYSGHSRLHIECLVSNPGNAPALSVNVCSCVMLQQGDEKDCGSYKSAMEYIDILSMGEINDKSKSISFMFVEDLTGTIIDSIRSGSSKNAPVLRICAAYKNMLGACFVCRQAFQLFYNMEKQDEILENWQSQIAAFDSILKNEIKQMQILYGKNQEEWEELFKKSKDKYEKKFIGEDQKLIAIQIPKSFTTSTLSETKYKNMLSKSYYGHFLAAPDGCIANNEAEQTTPADA